MKLYLLLFILVNCMNDSYRKGLANKAKSMFDHAFEHYMQYAFPSDELDPILCKGENESLKEGKSRDSNPLNWNVNDVLGNFSLTLIDSLDTLALMGKQKEFENGVKLVIEKVQFDLDSRVQVFEVTIRVLGGLLSAHLLAIDRKLGFYIDWYHGELLDLAKDLGDRLMPAFETLYGLPFPRVNLRYGVDPAEVRACCTAGAGTLILEFGTLSRLSGDPKYEMAAKKALLEVWSRRSDLDLLGNLISSHL